LPLLKFQPSYIAGTIIVFPDFAFRLLFWSHQWSCVRDYLLL